METTFQKMQGYKDGGVPGTCYCDVFSKPVGYLK